MVPNERPDLVIALAALSLLVWVHLVAGRGGFWRIAPDMLEPTTKPPTHHPFVLAIVPARNEAAVIGATLPTLLSQDYAGRFHIVLVDDDSEDDTGRIAREAAASAGAAERLTVVRGAPPPAGWTGKLWAMSQGVAAAQQMNEPPELLLFTDADIRYDPFALSTLVAKHREHDTVLTSLMVKLRMESLAERWLVPAFVYFFRMLYPFEWVRRPGHSRAAAAGGCMLVDRAALTRAGGIAAIRHALIDDCALGALMKRVGPIWLGLTRDVHSVRPYPAFADIRAMVTRSAYAELRYSPWRLAGALLGLALVFFVPVAAVLSGDPVSRLLGVGAWAAMTLSFAPMVRFYNAPWWTAPALPLIAAVYCAFTVASALQHRRGRGGTWKGRAQAQMERHLDP